MNNNCIISNLDINDNENYVIKEEDITRFKKRYDTDIEFRNRCKERRKLNYQKMKDIQKNDNNNDFLKLSEKEINKLLLLQQELKKKKKKEYNDRYLQKKKLTEVTNK